MAQVFILDRNGNTGRSRKPTLKGKAGRLFRQREKAKKTTALWNACIIHPGRVDIAVSDISMREVKRIDIGNYRCNQGKITANTVRAKQKLRLGHRDLV